MSEHVCGACKDEPVLASGGRCARCAWESERDDLALRLDGARATLDHALRERDEAFALVYGRHPPSFPDRLQTLPAWARAYIGDIETNADPAGTVRSVTELRENCAGLALMLKECEAERDAARSEVEALKADALAAFRKRYDCEDEATPAELIRRALESEAAEHDRFKARGGEIDDLEECLDAALARELEAVRSMERTGFELRAAEATAERLRGALRGLLTKLDCYGLADHPWMTNAIAQVRALAASTGKEPNDG